MRIQSKYFYRHNHSDLPSGFKDMGLNIVAYHKIAAKASKEMSKYNDEAMIIKTVWVDPYTGKIIDSESRRH